jgi:hypothetical protein
MGQLRTELSGLLAKRQTASVHKAVDSHTCLGGHDCETCSRMQVQSAPHSRAECLVKVLREFTMQKFPDVVVHGLVGGPVWRLTMGADGKLHIEKILSLIQCSTRSFKS